MNEEPEVPEPSPEIPKGPFWTTLLFPPFVTLSANVAIGVGGGSVALSLFVPLFVVFVILGLTFRFQEIVQLRYRGRSFAFLSIAYFLGQIIVCLALWIGSCALVFPRLNLH